MTNDVEELSVLVLCKSELFFQTANGHTIKTEYPHSLQSAQLIADQNKVPLFEE